MEDYYKILGVNRISNSDDIKKSYQKIIIKASSQIEVVMPDDFKKINEAYQTLGNPEKKTHVRYAEK